MKKILKNIDKQFQSNKDKNIFFNGIQGSMKFIPETLKAIEQIREHDKVTESILINYITSRALDEFCSVNQYYSFDQKARDSLRTIYVDLFSNIKSRQYPVDIISRMHYKNLTRWLNETNSFAQKIYSTKDKIIEPVVCSEYSAELQMELLQIESTQINEPVLDIGCGKQGSLVNFFRDIGIEAYGFDRFAIKCSFLTQSDWFEYDFGFEKWGTIISNLGFSNHFKHHHLRNDGDFIRYAKTYMDILNSLKIGGKFHYAPDLPFIEHYLDEKKYKLIRKDIEKYEFKSVIIERLK